MARSFPALAARLDADRHPGHAAAHRTSARAAQSLRCDFDPEPAAAHDGAPGLQRDEIVLDIAKLDAVANLRRFARRATFAGARELPGRW
jgi:hypothetical protein